MSSSLNFLRVLYVRISDEDGKRSWESIGFIDEEGNMMLTRFKWATIGPKAFKNPYKVPSTGIPKDVKE